MKIDFKLRDILLSLVLLTRLPVPNLPDKWFERQAQAAWAFSITGALIGFLSLLMLLIAQHLGQPGMIGAGLALVVSIVCTGAMHEDGLADCADGFWGGFSADRRLEIMKDSHIGTYGVLALVLSLGLRWSALTAAVATFGPWVVVPVAALSRATMPVLMLSLPNARVSGLSHRVGTPSRGPALFGIGLAAGLAWIMLGLWPALLSISLCALGLWGVHHLAKAKIGGRTGDVLGASQQISELLCLLGLLSIA